MHPGPTRGSSRNALLILSAVTIVIAVTAVTASPARADIPLDEVKKVRLFGDVRLRGEWDWSSTAPDGTERDDRERARFRLRLGFGWDPSQHVSMAVRARSGNTNSQQSPHVTFVQSGDNGDADVLVDRAWIRFGTSGRWIWLGRNGSPFWAQNEHLFDDDIWFDGLGFGFDWKQERDRHQIRGALAAVPEGEASLDWNEQGFLGGVQYAYTRTMGNGNMTIAAGAYLIADDGDVANPVLLDQDYSIGMVSFQRAFKAGSLPITVGVDVLHNFDAPDAGVFNRDERSGAVVSAQFGSLKEKGDWLAGYWFARIEKYALVPFLAQDDWLRWGTATQTRSSNYQGHELRFAYAFTKALNLMARLYVVEGLERESAAAVSREDGNRLRLDLNWKF